MSLFKLPDSLQIWKNAAFDDGTSSKISSTPLREVSTNSFAPVDLDPSKENRGPEAIRPLLDAALPKKATTSVEFRHDTEFDETALDDEISRIEEEIARLNSRLEALRAKKAEREWRRRQTRRRIVPAKFMDPKQGAAARNPCTPASKRMDRAMKVTPARAGIRRRGVSLGPLEILATPGRPICQRPSPAKNLWPSALKKKTEESPAHQSGKANETPIGSVHDHKIPGLGKLETMEEDKETTKIININPKSQALATAIKMPTDAKKTLDTPGNASNRRRAISFGPVEIVASARFRRQNSLQEDTDKDVDKQPKRSSSISPESLKPYVIKPKALFQEIQSSASCKRPSKAAKGRVVPRRYSLTTITSEKQGNKRGKWSLPELSSGKTSALVTGSELEDQMKTDSQILHDLDVVVSSLSFTPSSPQSIMKLASMLPKIKTLRCNTERPRILDVQKELLSLTGGSHS